MENNSQARRWILTINNPKETDEEMEKYVKSLEHIKYAIFQREQGEEKGTIHFQMFLTFSISKRFSTIKTYFSTAHIEKAKGTNVQCRDYCSKSDTRVSGPYEIGDFAEERSRTDMKGFYELLDSGASDLQIRDLYPSLFLKEFNKIAELRAMRKVEKFKKQERDLEVIYVYGESGSGKTTYVNDLLRGQDSFHISLFDNSAFTGYTGEDILVIDEFKGQFRLQYINLLLDGSSFVKLRGLHFSGQACYTKVYIMSNFNYKDLYKDEQTENQGQFFGFCRRLHKVIRMENGKPIVEKDTIWEDIPEEEQKLYGHRKRIKQTIEYDKNGKSRIIYDRYASEQIKLEELPVIDSGEMPW